MSEPGAEIAGPSHETHSRSTFVLRSATTRPPSGNLGFTPGSGGKATTRTREGKGREFEPGRKMSLRRPILHPAEEAERREQFDFDEHQFWEFARENKEKIWYLLTTTLDIKTAAVEAERAKVAERDTMIAEKDTMIAERDTVIAERDTMLELLEEQVTRLREQLDNSNFENRENADVIARLVRQIYLGGRGAQAGVQAGAQDDTASFIKAEAPATSKKVINIPDPDRLNDGETGITFEEWLLAMRQKLKANADQFSSPYVRMAYVASRCEGLARKQIFPHMQPNTKLPYHDAEDIFTHLKIVFGEKAKKVRRQYELVRQRWRTEDS